MGSLLWTASRRVVSLLLFHVLPARRVARHRTSSVIRHRATRMLVAQVLYAHDDGHYMLGPGTYRAPIGNPYHDWRFGHDGVPHPATCGTCSRKTDPSYINPSFRVKRPNS